MPYTPPTGSAVNFDFGTTSQSGTAINALVQVAGRTRVANTLNTVLATRYVTPVGDGVNSTLTVTHNLNTVAVIVQVFVYDAGTGTWTNYNPTSITVTGANTVSIVFASTPTLNQYRVVVLG